MKSQKTDCGKLVETADHQKDLLKLNYIKYKELWDFANSWLEKFIDAEKGNFAEKFIYLWVTVNAWASISVNDIDNNKVDSYLVRRMAGSESLKERFETLYEYNKIFKINVNKFLKLGPIFQVLWMRNNDIPEWDYENEKRDDFNKKIQKSDPEKGKFLRINRKNNLLSPRCAYQHFERGEEIPTDWPHTLSMIYRIRCNLFHGGKNYASERDKNFITLAYEILWEMWKDEVPEKILGEIDKFISWDRALIRSGFKFKKEGNKYHFNQELGMNRRYLQELLGILGMQEFWENPVFSPEKPDVNEDAWLNAIENAHSGSEGGRPDDLIILDTYLAGLIRWINEIGIKTSHSCDGHGNRHPTIDLNNRQDAYLLDICLSTVSKGKIRLVGRRIENRRINNRRRIQNNFDRKWLLDVAENIFVNRNELKNLVQNARNMNLIINRNNLV